MSAPSLSLWRIDDALETLLAMREEAEREGDSEQIAALDKALDEYHEQRPAKIDSIAGLILRSQSNQAVLKQEIDRLKDRLAAEQALEERVKASTLAAMQRFDVKELKTETTRILRQANGGVQPIEIPTPDWIPEGLKRYTVKMPGDLYHWLWSVITEFEQNHAIHPLAHHVMDAAQAEPDTARIREALKQRFPCPECRDGIVDHGSEWEPEAIAQSPCPRCNGEGTVPATIPGVKLLERGEHLKIK